MAKFVPQHLECRDLMHAWTYVGDLVSSRDEKGIREYQRILQCERCLTQRVDVFRPTVIVQHLYDMCLVDEVPPSRAGGLVLCPVCYAAGWVESGFDIKQQV